MKKKWTKFLSILCILTCVLALTACGNKEESNKISYQDTDLTSFVDQLVSVMTDTESADYFLDMSDTDLDTQLEGAPIDAKTLRDMIQEWKNSAKEAGKYVSTGDYTITDTNKAVTVSTMLKCNTRNVEMTTVYDKNLMISSVTLVPQYTLSEKMGNAGINLLIGMGTVFIVLIFISFLIYCFKFIPKPKKKIEETLFDDDDDEVDDDEYDFVESEEAEDTELVAVIAAAVAASMGTSSIEASTDGFVVRSIKKRKW